MVYILAKKDMKTSRSTFTQVSSLTPTDFASVGKIQEDLLVEDRSVSHVDSMAREHQPLTEASSEYQDH